MKVVYSILAAAALLLLGCPQDGDFPCADDRFDCDDNTFEFTYLDSCEVTGELTAEIGDGDGSFAALAEGEGPRVHNGSQGGQHIVAGLKIYGADLDLYNLLKVQFRLESQDGQITSTRDLLLGQRAPILINADGDIEEHGVVIFLNDSWSRTAAILLTVEDPCGRVAEVRHPL